MKRIRHDTRAFCADSEFALVERFGDSPKGVIVRRRTSSGKRGYRSGWRTSRSSRRNAKEGGKGIAIRIVRAGRDRLDEVDPL